MPRKILISTREGIRPALAPLVSAYAQRGITVKWHIHEREIPSEETLSKASRTSDAALLIGCKRRAPRTVLSGPLLRREDGKQIPVGWLPAHDPKDLSSFVSAAAKAHARAQETNSLALLAQRHPRYLRLIDRIESILCAPNVLRWSADAIRPEEMSKGLSMGLGSALYLGHGRPSGWVGYYGFRAKDLAPAKAPLGALLSLCCNTASRRNVGLSFAEALPLNGISASVLGAVDDTLHIDNTRLSVRLTQTIKEGAETLGDLVLRSFGSSQNLFKSYRIIGDPLAPLKAPLTGLKQAQKLELFP